ncbi:LuxR C-terminal-related transcriptional regulator [Chryseolinea sp. T2]|uniref:LuxR C-terminal-related transcriptional regulator n=1 Tax=Chryseolinea sp. T2 TaxID=3129255 RepID=UPI003077372A
MSKATISSIFLPEKRRQARSGDRVMSGQEDSRFYNLDEIQQESAFSYFLGVDYIKKQFVFISKSIKNVLGYTSEFYLKAGLDFALECIHPKDLQKLHVTQKKILKVFYETPVESRKLLKFDSNFRIRRADGRYIQILRQTIFPDLTDDGEPLLDFSTCTDISRYKQDNTMKLTIYLMDIRGVKQIQEYDISDPETVLTKRQTQIMELIAEGMTSNQIAHKLVISVETVKNHRKKILESTGAKNTAEAMKITFGNRHNDS